MLTSTRQTPSTSTQCVHTGHPIGFPAFNATHSLQDSELVVGPTNALGLSLTLDTGSVPGQHLGTPVQVLVQYPWVEWFTSADQERTLNFQGSKSKAYVKENVPHTRKRFTFKGRCQYPTRLNDNKHGAILLAATDNMSRNRIQYDVTAPDGFIVQYAPKGSYRLNQNLEYFTPTPPSEIQIGIDTI